MGYFASTKSLNLREQRESDTDRLFDLINDPSVQRTGPGYAVPQGNKTRKAIPEFSDKTLLLVVIEAKELLDEDKEKAAPADESEKDRQKRREDALFVGLVSLSVEFPKNRDAMLGISLTRKWRGRGFGTEVMRWVVDYAFENLALHRISLSVLDGNASAIALYKSVGFVEEIRVRKHNWQDGKWGDVLHMGLLEEDWAAAKSQSG